MPDFSLGIGNLFGRFAKDEKQPERRSTGGGQSGTRAFSERFPTPKPIGGPVVSTLTGIGTGFQGLFDDGGIIFNRLIGGARQTSQDVQEVSGKTQEALGGAFTALTGAPGAVVGGVTAPVGQLSKDILPLAAIAAAIVLLK